MRILLITIVLLLLACSNEYSNYCDHGNRVYIGGAGFLAVVPNDPSCKEAAK